NVGITAVSWSPTTNLSILLWTHRLADPPNVINGPTTIIAGTQPYTCEPDRSYANVENPAGVVTALDPGDRTTLWVSHQWANSAARCVWNTRLIQYRIESSPRRRRWPHPVHVPENSLRPLPAAPSGHRTARFWGKLSLSSLFSWNGPWSQDANCHDVPRRNPPGVGPCVGRGAIPRRHPGRGHRSRRRH